MGCSLSSSRNAWIVGPICSRSLAAKIRRSGHQARPPGKCRRADWTHGRVQLAHMPMVGGNSRDLHDDRGVGNCAVTRLTRRPPLISGHLPPTGATGLEPATSGVTGRRSNRLSYAPKRVGPRSMASAARRRRASCDARGGGGPVATRDCERPAVADRDSGPPAARFPAGPRPCRRCCVPALGEIRLEAPGCEGHTQ